MINGKTVAESRTEQAQILLPMYVNSDFRLFGGQLMAWVDVVAGVVARRHSGSSVTTAAVERLDFLEPAVLDDTLVLVGHITYAGRTSMEVCVDTFVEGHNEQSGHRKLVNRAYLTMVAIDKQGKPTQVPELILTTDEERREYAEALERRKHRKISG